MRNSQNRGSVSLRTVAIVAVVIILAIESITHVSQQPRTQRDTGIDGARTDPTASRSV
jgi:hypothetical protein